MSPRDADATRARILDSARSVFSEIGYDGARMDDIASRAGVNKALIYYYYKSKEKLLETLFAEFLTRIGERVTDVANDPAMMLDEKAMTGLFERSLEFMEQHEDLLRIVMMESLKKNTRSPMVLRGLDAWRGDHIKELLGTAADAGMDVGDDLPQLLVTEFFTNSMPLIMFVLLNQHWEKHFGVSPESLRGQFIKAMLSTHIRHHQHQIKPRTRRA